MLKRMLLWRVGGRLRFSARESTARQHNGQRSEAQCCPAESDIEHDDVLLLQFTTRSGGGGVRYKRNDAQQRHCERR